MMDIACCLSGCGMPTPSYVEGTSPHTSDTVRGSCLSSADIPGASADREMRFDAPEAHASTCHADDEVPLIPGLPDDVSWSVLCRLPRAAIPQIRAVSRRWRAAVESDEYVESRRRDGFSEQWLYTSISDWQGSNSCFAFDPQEKKWQQLPPIPGSECRNVLTLQFAALSSCLLVSGMVEKDNPVAGANGVFLYCPRRNQWERGSSIHTGRWFCMSGVVDDALYVAGGVGTSNNLSLVQTVERFRAEMQQWEVVETSSKAELMTLPGYQAVVDGKLLAKNIGWGPRLGVSFDPKTGVIEELPLSMVQGWQGPTAAFGSRLLIVDFTDDFYLKQWDASIKCWRRVGNIRLPAEGHKPWAVQLVVLSTMLALVLPNLSLICVDLGWVVKECTDDASVVVIDAPTFKNVAGEPSVAGSTAAVLGCQVLHL